MHYNLANNTLIHRRSVHDSLRYYIIETACYASLIGFSCTSMFREWQTSALFGALHWNLLRCTFHPRCFQLRTISSLLIGRNVNYSHKQVLSYNIKLTGFFLTFPNSSLCGVSTPYFGTWPVKLLVCLSLRTPVICVIGRFLPDSFWFSFSLWLPSFSSILNDGISSSCCLSETIEITGTLLLWQYFSQKTNLLCLLDRLVLQQFFFSIM